MRQYDKAIDTELRCIRRQPKLFWSHVVLGWAYEQKGRYREALAELREGVKLMEGDAFALAAYGEALAASGDRRGALAVLADLKQRAEKKYVSAYDIAMVYSGLHDRDNAFRWLEKAQHDRASFLPYVTWDRRADPLRGDARFRAFLQRMGLPEDVTSSSQR